MDSSWKPTADALSLLDKAGGPFASRAYRDAMVEADLGWRDSSFGAALEDGTRAALPLLVSGRVADSVPFGYGGIAATRALAADELSSFLAAAARHAGVGTLTARSVPPLGATPIHAGGVVAGSTRLLLLDALPPERAFSPRAAQSIRRAARAGCEVRIGQDAASAFGVYGIAAKARTVRYPDSVIRRLAAAGIAWFYDVLIGGEPVATLIALRDADHWMYWIAAQTDAGRKAEAGYLALARMIADAHASGTRAVNLGASAGLPGVAQFKLRFGGIEVPIVEYRYVDLRARLRAPLFRAAVRGRTAVRSRLPRSRERK